MIDALIFPNRMRGRRRGLTGGEETDNFRIADNSPAMFNYDGSRGLGRSKGDQTMPLTNDVRDEIKAAKKLRMPGWAVACVIIVSFLCAQQFDRFGKLSLVLPILNSIGVLGFMLALKRKLWRHTWFWGTMAVIAALHVPLILLVPWTTRWVPALAFGVIDSLDFCLILWILAVVGKFMREQKGAER